MKNNVILASIATLFLILLAIVVAGEPENLSSSTTTLGIKEQQGQSSRMETTREISSNRPSQQGERNTSDVRPARTTWQSMILTVYGLILTIFAASALLFREAEEEPSEETGGLHLLNGFLFITIGAFYF